MSGPLRVAVVGLGGITQSVHLPLIARRWDLFELTALVDLSAERAANLGRRYAVPPARHFPSVEALLQAVAQGLELDGVVLATSGSHGPPLLQLVGAGLPVLCEKPVALSTKEVDAVADEFQQQARDSATALMVGYMKEHDPAVAGARSELVGKDLRAVTVEVLHPADAAQLGFARLLPAPSDVDSTVLDRLQWADGQVVDAAVGADTTAELRTLYTNVVLGSIVHDISLLRYLVGGITAVDNACHWGQLPGSVQVTGKVAGGAGLHVGWHFIADYPDYRETVTFHHEQGSVQLVFPVPYLLNAATDLIVTRRAAGDIGESRATYRWSQQEAFENELLAFHAMVTDGVVPPSGLEQGRADLVTGQAILASLARQKGVPVGGEAARA